jgi:hypothetical protein
MTTRRQAASPSKAANMRGLPDETGEQAQFDDCEYPGRPSSLQSGGGIASRTVILSGGSSYLKQLMKGKTQVD